jgi:hypothetical protein
VCLNSIFCTSSPLPQLLTNLAVQARYVNSCISFPNMVLIWFLMLILQILQTLNIANVFVDPKTIIDKPTSKPPQTVISDFAPLNGTEAQVITFLDNDFAGEGQELKGVALPRFTANPMFLNNITDPLAKAFAGAVHGFWPSLTRSTDKSKECDGKKCESTLIPLNHTFVVPGELYFHVPVLSSPCTDMFNQVGTSEKSITGILSGL